MTREQVELVRQLFEPYGNLPGYGPALDLVAHAAELQAFVLDVAEGLDSPRVPACHEVNRLLRQAKALRAKIDPIKGQRRGR